MKNLYKKTYGVSGLIDWQANIKAGKASLVVNFTGGGLSSYGVTPAEYTTENILYQKIIENSKYFKLGKIVLLRSIPLDGTPVKKAVQEETKKDMQVVEEVRNCADARNWLAENKDISSYAKSKAEIIEIASANGVVFPNLMK